jgi:hypothetical protein
MSGKKVKGEEASLGFEGRGKAVVPDGEIGAGDLFGEGELGGDHAFSKAGREAADIDETPALGEGGAGDGDDFIEVGLSGGFKEERDIDGEPGVAGLLADRPRKLEPGAANGGVQDGLERLPPHRVRKDNGAKRGALQDPGGIEDAGAELVADGAKDNGIRGGQFPGETVAIKDAQVRQEPFETFREECLAGCNPARDTQN